MMGERESVVEKIVHEKNIPLKVPCVVFRSVK